VLDDLRQIDLDVTQGRTSGKLFKNEKLRNFTSALEVGCHSPPMRKV